MDAGVLGGRARDQPLAAAKGVLGGLSLLASLACLGLLLTLPRGGAASWQAEAALSLAGVAIATFVAVAVAVVVDAGVHGWRYVRAGHRSLGEAEEGLVVHGLLLSFAALSAFVFVVTYPFLASWTDAGVVGIVVLTLLAPLTTGALLAVAALLHGASVLFGAGPDEVSRE